MKLLAVVVIAAAALLAGCGGEDAPTQLEQRSAYFLIDGQVWPALRETAEDDPYGVVADLVEGPTDDEADLGMTTAFTEGIDVSISNGLATVDGDVELTREQLAQLVYTLTQPGLEVNAVDAGGTTYTRADFEEQTPSVLVESPLPFEEVATPITLWGTANTFEATFHYELLDADGDVIDENFVTASSGTGTRGTFEIPTADVDGAAALVVFERSAEDGSRMREVRIPLNQVS